MATWRILLSGSAGSLLGVVGIFAVFWLTGRRDRALEADRRALEQVAVGVAARDATIARVVRAVSMQAKDVMWAPLARAQQLELFGAVLEVTRAVGAAHPAVANWVLQQHNNISEQRRRYWRYMYLPYVRVARREAWAFELGALAGQLVAWQQGHIEDDWFGQRLTDTPSRQLSGLLVSHSRKTATE